MGLWHTVVDLAALGGTVISAVLLWDQRHELYLRWRSLTAPKPKPPTFSESDRRSVIVFHAIKGQPPSLSDKAAKGFQKSFQRHT